VDLVVVELVKIHITLEVAGLLVKEIVEAM
jgi:hypothetical protein